MERLREIINKKKINKVDKMYIDERAQDSNFVYDLHSTCSECYRDKAIMLLKHLQENDISQEVSVSVRKIRVKKNIDIIVNGMRVNDVTIKTDEQAQHLLDMGLSKKYFDFYADNGEDLI
jgi:hypothetical protein